MGLDQLAHTVLAVTQHLGRVANGGRHHFIADHHDAQVEAGMEAFQQHPAIELAGMADRLGYVVDAGQGLPLRPGLVRRQRA